MEGMDFEGTPWKIGLGQMEWQSLEEEKKIIPVEFLFDSFFFFLRERYQHGSSYIGFYIFSD